jgi:HD-GYP domain-containing protein (c-di-GMP phosphodiesterase class II)
MTSDRPYRKALPLETAVIELHEHAGTQFDPAIIDVFSQVIEDGTFFRSRFNSAPPAAVDSIGYA